MKDTNLIIENVMKKEFTANAVPYISIIIPVYNVEKYLEKCILSVVKQTIQSVEIILVNDGSTDSSSEIIKKYAEKYTNIRIVNKENGGLSSARNVGLDIATGEYVTFLDSDDYIKADYLETLYAAAKKYDSDMVVSGQYKVDDDGKVLSEILYPVKNEGNCIFRKMNIAGKIYRRSYIEKHHMRFAIGKTYEDNPFNFMALFLAQNIIFLQYAGYCQIVHTGSITTKKIDDRKLPYRELEKSIRYVLKHETEINDKEIFEFTLISFLTYFIFQANKSHKYIKLEHRKSDWKVVKHFCRYSMYLLNKYFPKYYQNKYIGPCTSYKLPRIQKVGTWAFTILCRFKMLELFARIYYLV